MRTFVLGLLLVSCAKTEIIRNEPTYRAPPATPSATATPSAVAIPESTFLPVARLPKEYATLGTPCDLTSDACGNDGRVARVIVSSPSVGMPIGIVRFWLDRDAPAPSATTIGHMMPHSVGFERDTVWKQSSCPTCRIMMNATEVILVKTVKESQLVAFQTNLGLPASPLLRTPDAFKQALGSRLKS